MSSDYPHGRGRARIDAAGIEIDGVSIAGHESFYKLPSFHVLLEFGRAPEDTVGYSTICLSHGHLDHAAGLAHHASRRRLAGLPRARVFVPEEAVSDVRQWISACERLEDVRYGLDIVAARSGDSFPLRRDLKIRFLPGRHRVPTVGYLFSEVRAKLKTEFRDLRGSEIAALRGRGVEITRIEEIPLLAYPGDCGVEIFEAVPELFSSKVLLIECSFLLPEDLGRARGYGHLHLEDFLERADLFQNEAVVLTHFSQRYRPEEIREALARLPPRLAERVIPFLP
jgi:ribonuclease Z